MPGIRSKLGVLHSTFFILAKQTIHWLAAQFCSCMRRRSVGNSNRHAATNLPSAGRCTGCAPWRDLGVRRVVAVKRMNGPPIPWAIPPFHPVVYLHIAQYHSTMARHFASLALAFSLATGAFAQPLQNHNLPVGLTRSYRAFDLGAGNSAYIADRAFSFDSSRVELLWTDASQSTVNAVSRRLVYPYAFLNDAVKLDDGYLIGGGNYSSLTTLPFLLKTDLSGAVSWYAHVDNFGTFDQDQIVALLSRGNAFTAYSYKGGTYDNHIYRVDGVPNGTSYTGQRIAANSQFRVYSAMATADPLRHLLGGSGTPSTTPGNLHALLMMVGGVDAPWIKHYDMGSDFTEDIYGLTATADGNYVVCGYATSAGSFYGLLMKVDPAGNVLWCRKLEDVSGGLQLSAVHELGDGSLLVCGTNGDYDGALAKLDANGNPLWVRQFPDDRLARFTTSGGTLLACGAYSRIELDDEGVGCGFNEVANLTATPLNPTVVDMALNVTAFAPTTTALSSQPRTPELDFSAGCIWSGVEEHDQVQRLSLYPVPTEGHVFIAGDAVRAGDAVVVRNLMGQEVQRAAYRDGLDLSALPSGSYMLEVLRTGARGQVVRR